MITSCEVDGRWFIDRLAVGAAMFCVAATSSFAATQYMRDSIDDVRVAPLVETVWGQGQAGGQNCYNAMTPNNYSCGCVATAAGQLMRKWRHPSAAAVKVTNAECAIDGTATSRTMLGGPGVSYDWDSMPLVPANEASLSTAQCEAIGTLLYDIGVAVGMNWTSSGSSSSTALMFDQLTATFGYANAAIAGNAAGTGLSLDQFTRAVLPSLDAGMPVLVGIGGANTAHAVLCDGYGYHDGDLYVHINMGQAVESSTPADYNNTWYKFPTNNPEANGVSLWMGGEQSYLNPVIYNISPTAAPGSSVVSGRILDASGNPVSGVKVRAANARGVVATATSSASGVYGLVLSAGEYWITAGAEGEYSKRIVTVVATEGERSGDGGAQNVVIGNQSGIDLVPASVVDVFVEYVEATGAQYVDTGVEGRAGTKAEFKFTTTAPYQNDQMILGSRTSSGANRMFHTYLYSKGSPRVNIGYGAAYNRTTWQYAAPSTHAMQTEFTTNGIVKAANNGSAAADKVSGEGFVTSGCTMYAMACNSGGTAGMFAKAKLHYMRIWTTDADGAYQLVRDYTPCIKDGRAGLYDAVSKTVFYSQGSADFVTPARAWIPARPDGMFEYVESTGSQYIDTGVIGRHGTKTEMKYAMTLLSGDQWLLGSRSTSSSADRIFPHYQWGESIRIGYGSKYSRYNYYDPHSYTNVVHLLTTEFTDAGVVSSTLVRDGETVTPAGTDRLTSGETIDNGLAMYAFALNLGGTATGYAKAKLYSMKIWQTDASGASRFVRDYVPCVKDGRAGLYDRVSKNIFFSLGSADFTVGGKALAVSGGPDEYIRSVIATGTQYIDTEVEGRRGAKTEMHVAWTAFGGYQEMLGAAFSDNRCNLCDLYGAKPSYSYGPKYGTFDSGLTSARTAGTIYHVVSEAAAKEVLTINGWTGVLNAATEVADDFTSGLNLYLFARNWNGAADLNARARLYDAKIWLDDALVRNYRPCLKDGRAGLYDEVSGMVFFSIGSEEFEAGPAFVVSGESDSIVEYIESSGSQYIDTGVTARYGTKAEMRFAMNADTANPVIRTCLLAAWGSGSGNDRKIEFCWSGKSSATSRNVGAYFCGVQTYWGSDVDPSVFTFRSELSTNNQSVVYHGGRNADSTKNVSVANADIGVNLYAFACNDNGTADQFCKAKLYSMKIWQVPDGGADYELVRSYVPCVKDGRAGLYDAVSGKVYFSLGMEDFSAEGARVLSVRGAPDRLLRYVESDGSQYIDTGVVGRDGTKAEIDFKFNELGSSSIIFLGADDSDPWGNDNKFYLLAYRASTGNLTDGYAARYNGIARATTDRCKVMAEAETGGVFKTTLDGATATHDYSSNPGPYNIGLSLYLFTNNRNGTAGALSAKARCYGLKIWQTDGNGDYQPVRSYKPCLKDGRAGLYDEVSGTIYFSLSATDFVASPPPKGLMIIAK